MVDEPQASRGGDRRGRDRRKRDRRKGDRRTPPPVWRRPWAFVAYGVAGALVVFLLLGVFGDGEEVEPVAGGVRQAPVEPSVSDTPLRGADLPTEDAYTASEYARLVAEGSAAVGQRVRTELRCGPIRSVALHQVEEINPSIAELVDADGRVPAAECMWGEPDGAGGQDFLLLVPPDLAGAFAAAPEITEGFVERALIHGEVEWIGRSDALALRTVGILRSLLPER